MKYPYHCYFTLCLLNDYDNDFLENEILKALEYARISLRYTRIKGRFNSQDSYDAYFCDINIKYNIHTLISLKNTNLGSYLESDYLIKKRTLHKNPFIH